MDFEEIPSSIDDLPPPPSVPENNLSYDSVYELDENVLPDPDPVQEDALTKFLKEWGRKLDAKREAEYDHEKATRQKAADDLSNWKQQREIRLTAKKDSNRSEEQVLLETLESETEVLKVWERVMKLIDSNEVVASELKGSDTTRMRKLFIQLKNEPLEVTRGTAVAAK
mmetsp:Transcript_31271/g.34160  ORF Transcript_31271/g.34160 Transcript_31271/m.34160 type:complete len:169 (+) Transcript_31271:81-587(+)|eukprot:CAMPEP_0173153894 /NCGR_PEP_ID=MMETSP1105-20130129/13138_1 /TAXON_ID=2985 /ORGANISM="Ochromonas sp., Strain BG-1" /LENGTH=168 /DNA_ID=CAMNT_0014069929 /DNA_START=71 /DNA_END=577 /DNA_ORIENTATION=+